MVQGNGRVWPKWPRRIGSRQRVWGSIHFPQKTDDVNFSGEKTAFIVLTNTNKSSYFYTCPESCLCGKAFSHASHIKTARNSERTVSAMAVLWVAGAAHAEDFRGKTRCRWPIIRGITAKHQKCDPCSAAESENHFAGAVDTDTGPAPIFPKSPPRSSP